MRDIIDEFSRDKTLRVALKQSAVDSCCSPEDFLKKDNVVTEDEVAVCEKEIDKLLAEAVAEVDKATKEKEQEVMTV